MSAAEMASHGMICLPSFMMNGTGIQGILHQQFDWL
jgi:hypothetical protein